MTSTTLNDLLTESCHPLAKGTASLSKPETEELLALISEWTICKDGKSISRNYKFKNYYETMSFVNVAAWIAHQQDHHPDILLTYNHCLITYSTHSVDGLSRNDFICAAKTDDLR